MAGGAPSDHKTRQNGHVITVDIEIAKKPFAETTIGGSVGVHSVSLQSEAWLARRSVIAGTIDDGAVELTATGRLFGNQELSGEMPLGATDLSIEFHLRRVHVTGDVGPDSIDLTIERSVLKPFAISAHADFAAVHLEMAKRLKSGSLTGEVVRPADAFVIAVVSPTLLAIFDRRA